MKKKKIEVKTETYNCFEIHTYEDNYSFFHIDFSDSDKFYYGLISYLFDEDKLLSYVRNKKNISFEPELSNFVLLFKKLSIFIDDELLEIDITDDDLEAILKDEFESYTDENGNSLIRLSKIGRFGEYIFHVLLDDYFGFDCIIPKVALTTDKNMSVYGIDALFFNSAEKAILFGESKITKSIENGVSLIQKSLKNYPKEIKEEYTLCLSGDLIVKSGLSEEILKHIENCISFEKFIENSNTENIGVPIFICHGEETSPEEILNKMNNRIDRKKLFNLNTQYYCISLPIISKEKFITLLTGSLKSKLSEYESKIDG